MINYILTPIWVFMEMFFWDILADTFFTRKKFGSGRNRVLGLLILTAVMSVSVTLFQDIVVLKLFFDFLLAYAYLWAFYNTTLWEAVTVYLFHYSVLISVDFIGVSGYLYAMKNSENLMMYYVMCFVVKTVEVGIGFLIYRLWKRGSGRSVRPKEMRAFFPSFGIIVGAGVFASEILMRTRTVPEEITVMMTGMIGLNAFLVFYLLLATRTEIEKNSLRDAARQTGMQLEIYKNKQDLYIKQGKRLHEYKNQLRTICDLLEQGADDRALQYIHELTGGMAKELDRICTNHPIADAILNIKKQEALDRGINLSFLCGDLKDISLKEEEIIILLGNLLDNAMEAAEKCESGRSVQVQIIQEERQLVVVVKNTYAQPLCWENGRAVSAKPDSDAHGYGLAAIQDIAERHDGIFVIKTEGEYVKATVLIPEP